jgi:hypothetical protein
VAGDAVGEVVGDALREVDGGVLLVEGTVRSKVLSAPVPSGGSALWSSSSAERNVESAIVTNTNTASTTGARTAVRG